MKQKILIALIPILFFLSSLWTLRDYGISWDEPIHFYRGQAYLWYFLTGEKNYESFPRIFEHQRAHFEQDKSKIYKSLAEVRKSYYQDETLPGEYFFAADSGHPPLSDILAALTNYIFYQKLGIMGDIESHHLFNILASTLLVFVVTVFAYQTYGIFAAVITGLAGSLYPLFWAESRFNIKDPTETAFFALTLWAFWRSLKKGSWQWLLLAVLGFALALGTKFNILFLPFIIGPYLITRYFSVLRIGWSHALAGVKRIPRVYLLIFLVSPLIVATIFFGFWPFLWQDPIGNFLEITKFYKGIGTGYNYQQPGFYFGGFNAYPALWILTTTPPWILLLSSFGVFYTIKKWSEKENTSLLWLLWFLVPIARVSIPNTAIYGGVRQIMEYIPAMTLLAGVGAVWIAQKIQKFRNFKLYFCILTFVFLIYPIIRLHPNENVYFNSFIGGLPGAKVANIPYWGNSFGNAYWQALQWLNKNAEKDARVALIQGTGLSLPQLQLRPDISYWNNHWSGIRRAGEYLLELTHNDPVKVYQYAWDYVEKFLEPVYEVKVDGVAIARVWKNDIEHTKPEMRLREVLYSGPTVFKVEGMTIQAKLPREVLFSRMVIIFRATPSCGVASGRVQTSPDGENWFEEVEKVPFPQVNVIESFEGNRIQYFFAARQVKGVRFIADSSNSCILNNPKMEIFVLSK